MTHINEYLLADIILPWLC